MFSRYLHTVRHLRPIQVLWRVRRCFYHPRADRRPSPPQRTAGGAWTNPPARQPTMLAPERFCFLNEERELVFPQAWNAPETGKLWLYNLHYFDDLNAQDSAERRSWHSGLIRRWIRENPPVAGVGWEPYPLSLRIVNWIKWALAGQELSDEMRHSLAIQVRQLRRSLEFHLLGNHLFENAKALVFGGMFFSGDEGEKWLKAGRRLLERQLGEQILADGGHCELSPMYHALVLEGLLDVLNLHRTYGMEYPSEWRNIAARMIVWLRTMCHPDGDIAFFNDAALGVAHRCGELERYAEALDVPQRVRIPGSVLLQASGYARLERNDAVVLADVAAVGPDYLPGHAHADSLSFELSLHRHRVLVNSGTSVYGLGPERLRQRGTAAHNTVRLDKVDSSEIWAGFRVARRARVSVEHFDAASGDELRAFHDGYARLAGRPIHWRTWTLRDCDLEVEDDIEGNGTHWVEVFFYFHPGLRLDTAPAAAIAVLDSEGAALLHVHTDIGLDWRPMPGSWHPRFGVSEPSSCLKGEGRIALPARLVTRFSWEP